MDDVTGSTQQRADVLPQRSFVSYFQTWSEKLYVLTTSWTSQNLKNLPPNQKNNLHLFHRALSQCDAAHLSLIQPEDSEEECWETAHEQHAGISRIQTNEHQMSLTENQSSVQQRSSVWAQRMRTLVLFPVTLILCLWIKPAAYLIVSSPLPLRISHKITDTR